MTMNALHTRAIGEVEPMVGRPARVVAKSWYASLLGSVDLVLRSTDGVLELVRRDEHLAAFARHLVAVIFAGAAVFGASLGAFRGDIQIAFAALKLPLVLLFTTAIAAPALTALGRAQGRHSSLRADLVLVLSALARASLVLAACAPLVVLAVRLGAAYHTIVLLAASICAFAGALGLVHFVRGLFHLERRAWATTTIVLLGVFALVGSQMAWTLRPYLVRPRDGGTTFVRAIEGSFLDSVARSAQSASGHYSRDSAPLPNECCESGDVRHHADQDGRR